MVICTVSFSTRLLFNVMMNYLKFLLQTLLVGRVILDMGVLILVGRVRGRVSGHDRGADDVVRDGAGIERLGGGVAVFGEEVGGGRGGIVSLGGGDEIVRLLESVGHPLAHDDVQDPDPLLFLLSCAKVKFLNVH